MNFIAETQLIFPEMNGNEGKEEGSNQAELFKINITKTFDLNNNLKKMNSKIVPNYKSKIYDSVQTNLKAIQEENEDHPEQPKIKDSEITRKINGDDEVPEEAMDFIQRRQIEKSSMTKRRNFEQINGHEKANMGPRKTIPYNFKVKQEPTQIDFLGVPGTQAQVN